MATPPVFSNATPLDASSLNAIGLWLVKTQTVGTGVTSVAVTNAFSADFENYFVTYSGGSASTNPVLTLVLGASTTAYYNSMPYVPFATGVTAAVAGNNAARFDWAGYAGPNYTGMNIWIFEPYLAKYTRVNAAYAAENEAGNMVGIHKVAASYTGFTMGVSAGTITGGTIRVYGYRN